MELRLCKIFIFSLSAKRLPLRVRNFHCELLSLTFSFTTQGAYVMYDESHQHDKKANHKQISISSLHSDSKHMLDWWAAKKKLVIFLWVVFGESGFLKLVETHVVVSLSLSHLTLLFYYCCLFQINEYLVVCTFCRYWEDYLCDGARAFVALWWFCFCIEQLEIW